MSAVEVLDEVEWLLDGGVHPLMVCQVMNRRPDSVEKAAARLGRDRVRVAFSAVSKQERVVRERAALKRAEREVAA
jgi:phosphoribosylformimino-5-aminoimidazole carboxamide ribonucleotide (ProFAR) isomerase